MSRNVRFDVAKGIAILAVITIHVTGNRSRQIAVEGSQFWWWLRYINLAAAFAVPCFLLISAWLWTISLERKSDLWEFVKTRFVSLAHPYLLWSLIYITFRTRAGTFEPWPSLSRIGFELSFGKSAYHLYFMVLIAQLILIVPLFAWIFKRFKVGFWAMMAMTVIVEFAILAIQQRTHVVVSFGSFAPGYAPVLLPAIWLGLNPAQPDSYLSPLNYFGPKDLEQAEPKLGKHFRVKVALTRISVLIAAAIVISAYYFQGNTMLLAKLPLNGVSLQQVSLLYTSVFAWLVVLLSRILPFQRTVETGLAWLGKNSLAIYLAHPAFLVVLTSPSVSRVLPKGYINVPIVWFGTVLISGGFAIAVEKMGLNGILFGQWRRKPPVPPTENPLPAS
jgi:fucose 4-O-acetylase-like acetyltransferase